MLKEPDFAIARAVELERHYSPGKVSLRLRDREFDASLSRGCRPARQLPAMLRLIIPFVNQSQASELSILRCSPVSEEGLADSCKGELLPRRQCCLMDVPFFRSHRVGKQRNSSTDGGFLKALHDPSPADFS